MVLVNCPDCKSIRLLTHHGVSAPVQEIPKTLRILV